MKKIYCDRCGKETDTASEKYIPTTINEFGTLTTERYELCNDCYSEYQRLNRTVIRKLTELHLTICKEFVKKPEVS
jgi:hypothetical protein